MSDSNNATNKPYRFHAYEVSLFSAKVRPALRYKQLYFEEVRADIAEIVKRTGLGFIPIVLTPEDEVWQDSSEILDRLEARHPSPPLYPETSLQRMICALMELYSDEFGVTPAMHTRWGSEDGERYTRARFGAMMGSAEAGNRAADRMVKGRYATGATPEAGPAIEAHLTDLLAALCTHFEEHDYLLGGRMSLADCALMGPLYGHLFTDIVSRTMLHDTSLPVIRWIEYCSVPTTDSQGDWFRADGITDSLYEILKVMGQDAVSTILGSIQAVETHADDHAVVGEIPPRVVGQAESDLRGTTLSRVAQTYSLWMFQRVLDPYLALSDADRARVDDALAGTGWEALLAYRPRHRLEKDGFGLVYSAQSSNEP